MSVFVTIYCSRCAMRRRLSTKDGARGAAAAIGAGWGSYGGALYCPKCTKTWNERNSKHMADPFNTLFLIMDEEIMALEAARTEV